MSNVHKESITIWSQGVRLAGDIYKPENLKESVELPGIVMVPGWGGNKKNLEKNYAPHFAAQGFIVLAFDFKGWGESEGPLGLSIGELGAAASLTWAESGPKRIIRRFPPLTLRGGGGGNDA